MNQPVSSENHPEAPLVLEVQYHPCHLSVLEYLVVLLAQYRLYHLSALEGLVVLEDLVRHLVHPVREGLVGLPVPARLEIQDHPSHLEPHFHHLVLLHLDHLCHPFHLSHQDRPWALVGRVAPDHLSVLEDHFYGKPVEIQGVKP